VQEHERRDTGRGGKVQPAARRQIKTACDDAGDHGEACGRSERLLECPQRVPVAPGLDDDEAGGIKTPLDEPMTIGGAKIHATARLEDEDGKAWTRTERHGHQSKDEAEGRRRIAVGIRGDLVENSTGEAGLRQMGMHLARPERQVRA